MALPQEFRRELEDRIAELRAQLEPLEAGTSHYGKRGAGAAEWVDVTPKTIASIKREIASYQAVLREHFGVTKLAECAKCGAWADLEGTTVSWN